MIGEFVFFWVILINENVANSALKLWGAAKSEDSVWRHPKRVQR